VEDTLDWISYRSTKKTPQELKKDFALLVDSVIDPIEVLSTMVAQAREYFKNLLRRSTSRGQRYHSQIAPARTRGR